jgi:hypothetical protein
LLAACFVALSSPDHVAQVSETRPRATKEAARPPGRRLRISGFDLVVLGVFAAMSAWVLGLDLWQVIVHGRHWTGTDGVFLEDQMEYLAWIRSASVHFLASDLFVLQPTPADYFQPIIAASGAIVAVGVAPWLTLLLWKPVAVGGVFFATRAYVYRSLPERTASRAALVVALFFTGPGELIAVKLLHVGVIPHLQWQVVTGDAALGFWSWDYPFGMIGLAAMVAALLSYERGRATRRLGWAAPLLAALASSLHPWQGATLILVLLCAEAVMWRSGNRVETRALLLTVLAAALPLAYYQILERSDPLWKVALDAQSGSWPFGIVVLMLAPLALPAALAYRARPRTFLAAATRIWPLVALAIFLASEQLGGAATHAFLGISIPLAILSVQGLRELRWPHSRRYRTMLAALAIAAVTVPGSVYELTIARGLVAPGPSRGTVNGPGDANFLDRGEPDALSFLARDPRPGGVLTRAYLGEIVPAITGRSTYVGNSYWSFTPRGGTSEFYRRVGIADALFQGRMTPLAARTFVRNSGARFLLADCESRSDLGAVLAPIIRSTHRFGCASVYTIS